MHGLQDSLDTGARMGRVIIEQLAQKYEDIQFLGGETVTFHILHIFQDFLYLLQKIIELVLF
jgi:hypothetical protein